VKKQLNIVGIFFLTILTGTKYMLRECLLLNKTKFKNNNAYVV